MAITDMETNTNKNKSKAINMLIILQGGFGEVKTIDNPSIPESV